LSSIRGVFNDGRYVSDNGENYLYFLPLEKVKEKAQYRKFKSVKEMEDYLEISLGDAICLRSINSKDMPYKVMYVGCGLNDDNNDRIILGHAMYDFEELFEKYQVCKEGEEIWRPFGINEKMPNAKDYVPQPPTVLNALINSIKDHLVSLEETDNIAKFIGEKGYFFDMDNTLEIANKILSNDGADSDYGTFSGVSTASIMYPLLCESTIHDKDLTNWKFFVPEKYLEGLI
jgi:hypothetical protein